jgi:hypothetical protein
MYKYYSWLAKFIQWSRVRDIDRLAGSHAPARLASRRAPMISLQHHDFVFPDQQRSFMLYTVDKSRWYHNHGKSREKEPKNWV